MMDNPLKNSEYHQEAESPEKQLFQAILQQTVTPRPTGPTDGHYNVLRGGSYMSSSGFLQSAYRHFEKPDSKFDDFGFRVVHD